MDDSQSNLVNDSVLGPRNTKKCFIYGHTFDFWTKDDGLCPRRFLTVIQTLKNATADSQTDRCLRILVLPVTCLAIALVRGWAKTKEVELTMVSIVHQKGSRTWNIETAISEIFRPVVRQNP